MKIVKWLAVTIAAVLIGLLVTSVVNKIAENSTQDELKGYTEISNLSLSYKVGEIDSDGKGAKSDTSMYTDKATKATEVKVVIAFENNILYIILHLTMSIPLTMIYIH